MESSRAPSITREMRDGPHEVAASELPRAVTGRGNGESSFLEMTGARPVLHSDGGVLAS